VGSGVAAANDENVRSAGATWASAGYQQPKSAGFVTDMRFVTGMALVG